MNLEKFNPQIIEEKRQSGIHPSIAIVGKRATGKTKMAEEIYKQFKQPITTFVITSEHNKHIWKKYVDEKFIFNFDPDLLDNILTEQNKKIKQLKTHGIDIITRRDIDICIIFDEVLFDRKQFQLQSIKNFFFNGRHLNITLISTLQTLVQLSPEYRTCIDYFIFCNENNEDEQKRIHQKIFQQFENFEDFQKVFEKYTKDNGFLICDQTSFSNQIEKSVFWFKKEKEVSEEISEEVQQEVSEDSFFEKIINFFC